MTPEGKVTDKIKKYLKTLKKIWFVKISHRFLAGIPDIIGVKNGRFFAIEVKAPKSKPTKLQLHTLNLISKAGGIAKTAYSVDDVKKVLS